MSELEKDALDQIRQKCKELDDAKIRVEAEVANIKSELEEETRATTALTNQLKKAEEALLAEREKSSNSQVEMSMQIEQLEDKVCSMEAVEQQQQQLIDKLTITYEGHRMEQELQLNQQQEESQMKDSQYKLEITALNNELLTLQKAHSEALESLQKIPNLEQQLQTQQATIESLTESNADLKSQLSATTHKYDGALNEITLLKESMNEKITETNTLRENHDKLKRETQARKVNLQVSTSMIRQLRLVPEPTVITQTVSVPVEVQTPCPYDHEFWEREAALAKVCLDQNDVERQLLIEKADCYAKVASQKTHKLRLQKELNLNSETEIRDLKRINHELSKQVDALQAELHHTASITDIKNSQLGILATSITSLVNDLRGAITPLSPMVVVPPDPSDLNSSVKELFSHFRILTGRASY
eukprot:TRINITY_DN2656_c0_g2_i1.p1 TRINITY_DN2656_c0_g2~~TRINITY_DN2656_c0_g2_i1.p1  ORF type:complete len:445 (+),score=95.63 TRINITY_DN2656_c0_g2_i1:85-1335(+)